MQKQESLLLLIVVAIIATCGIIYELVASTLASYLMGDTVFQFSTIIGCYLFAMGVGSYLSKYFNTNLLDHFVNIEFLVGLVGGLSAAILFLLFNIVFSFSAILYFLVFIIGLLVGLEIPLLMRILKDTLNFENLVSRVFAFDYLGALFASIIFPLLLIPYLGLIKTSIVFGMLNTISGLLICFKLKKQLKKSKILFVAGVTVLLILGFAFIWANKILSISESLTFPGNVIASKTSPYQRIVITRNKKEIRLFLNNNLQFSTKDECRYHEALVHPLLETASSIENVLILGGGDGLALREILKYNEVKKVTIVDLDKEVTKLFKTHPLLCSINDSAYYNPKALLINDDAYRWLKSNDISNFNAVVVDFPDPSNYAIGKLYSSAFYKLLYAKCNDNAKIVIQCTSPYAAKKSFWCINKTLAESGFQTLPYYNNVPSFGIWGYILASKKIDFTVKRKIPLGLKFYNEKSFEAMQNFSADMMPTDSIEVNKLNNQVLVSYFDKEWNEYLNL